MNTLGKKGGRKVPQSVKTNRKIDAAIEDRNRFYGGVISRQEHKYEAEIEQIKQSYVSAEIGEFKQQISLLPVPNPSGGLLIPNAKDGLKLFSNIAFASIIGTQAFFANVDPEVIAALPENIQYYVTAIQALVGIAARLINQSKRKGVTNV